MQVHCRQFYFLSIRASQNSLQPFSKTAIYEDSQRDFIFSVLAFLPSSTYLRTYKLHRRRLSPPSDQPVQFQNSSKAIMGSASVYFLPILFETRTSTTTLFISIWAIFFSKHCHFPYENISLMFNSILFQPCSIMDEPSVGTESVGICTPKLRVEKDSHPIVSHPCLLWYENPA